MRAERRIMARMYRSGDEFTVKPNFQISAQRPAVAALDTGGQVIQVTSAAALVAADFVL
jgi:hypothetical protein